MKKHVYISTACLHDLHDYCKAEVNPAGIAKVPATCKFCAAHCWCLCHRIEKANSEATKGKQ